MKTPILLTTLALSAMTSFSFAIEPEKALTNSIRHQLSVPESLRKSKETIRVDFQINERGIAEVLKIYSNNPTTRSEVQKQFHQMKHDKSSYTTGKIYSIKVTFRVL